MQAKEEKAPVTDTYLEDYEEFLDEEERWRPQGTGDFRRRKTTFPQRRRVEVRAR